MAVQLELKEVLLIYDIAENVSFTGDFQWTKEALEKYCEKTAWNTHRPDGQIQIEAAGKIPIYTEIIVRDNGQEFKKKIYHTCLSGFTVAKERKIQEWVSDFHWQQKIVRRQERNDKGI